MRVKDLDFEQQQITVRDGKGGQDRRTVFQRRLSEQLQRHLQEGRLVHQKDLAEGHGRVALPHALARKYPPASVDWGWQWVFPQRQRWRNPDTGEVGRHHLDPSLIQKAMRGAVLVAGLHKPATSHTPRHPFASHLLERGQDICTIQELMGLSDLNTIMIDIHVLNRGPLGVSSPADLL